MLSYCGELREVVLYLSPKVRWKLMIVEPLEITLFRLSSTSLITISTSTSVHVHRSIQLVNQLINLYVINKKLCSQIRLPQGIPNGIKA